MPDEGSLRAALPLPRIRAWESDDADAPPWQAMVEGSPVAVAVLDASGRFSYGNVRALALCGVRDVASLTALTWADVVAPGQHELVRSAFAVALSGTSVTGQRWTFCTSHGEAQVAVNAAPIVIAGRPAVQLQLRDVSAQALADETVRASEARWQMLFDLSPVAIALADEGGRLIKANPALLTLLGRPEPEVLGRRALSFFDGHLPRAEVGALIAAAPQGAAQFERRLTRPDGTVRWVWVTITRAAGPDGQTYGLAHLVDVTAQHEATAKLAESESNLRTVGAVVRQIQSGGDARQAVVDAGLALGQAAFVSLAEPGADGSSLRITAATLPWLVGIEVPADEVSATMLTFRTGRALLIPDPHDDPTVSQDLLARADARSLFLLPVFDGPTVSGVMVVAWTHRVADLDDHRAAIMTVLADEAGVALRHAALRDELGQLAMTDQLTRLPNRRSWDESLGALLTAPGALVVALADLDHFKAFNDDRGHLAGDALLQEFAAAASTVVRPGQLMCRWGGEEFALALPGCSVEGAQRVLERVRESVPGGQTCSIGFARWDGLETAEQLVARADFALYEAKRTGRDRVVADLP